MAAPHRSPSGVPVIDIVAPDANGLSHNRLREFDVGPPGLVFNNSLTEGRSQLAGYLNRNPGLRQAATAILTEITGTRPSRLHGALEVFGRRADLIVANPNGLSVDGLVTLNAGRLTLSTGRPVTEGGRLRLDVDAGHIAVAGAGVNTSGLDYFDLVARTVSLDGPVAAGAGARAAALAVVAGRNRFEPANGSVTPLAGSAGSGGSGYAIDGTAAGAMYGARITLLSSDSGVGVRQRGAVSSPGAITVSSRGEIRLREATAGAGHLAVDAGGAVAATALASGGAMRIAGEGAVQVGTATSGDALSLHAGGALQAQRLRADGPLDARAQGALRVGAADSLAGISIDTARRAELGTLQSRGALSVRAGGEVALEAAKTDGALRVDGAGVTLGTGSAGQARIDSSAFVHVGALAAVGAQAHGGGVEIHARDDVRVGEGRRGQGVAVRGDITIDATNGVLLLRNDVTADQGMVAASARAAVLEHASLRSGITPRARQARPDGGRPSVALRVQDVLFLNGTLRALDEAGAVVPGRHIEVVDGWVRIADEIAETVHDEESVVSDAVIAARSGAVLVEAGTFVNFGGGVGNGGKQGAGSDLTLRVRGDARNKGYISAGRRGELQVGAVLKNEFLIDSAGTQRIEAGRIENLGTIQSLGGEAGAQGLVIKAAESVAQAGVVAAERGVEISGRTEQRPVVAASARSSIAGERLLVQVASWDNRGSLALGQGGMRAEIAGRYAERGTASLDGEYAVSAQTIGIAGALRQGRGATALVARQEMTLAGRLGLAGPVRLDAGGALSNTGMASACDRLAVTAASFDNAAGGLLSAGSVDIAVRGAARNAGRLLSNQDIVLGAASFYNAAQAEARGNFAATVGAALENRGSLKAGGDLTLRAARIDNHGVAAAGHDVGLRSPQLRNSGQVAAGHDIRIVEGRELRNPGRLDARNDIELAVDDYANTGSIHADGNATLALARGTDRDLVIDTPDILPVALGALRVKARSLRVNTEIGVPGSLDVQTQGDIDNRQAIVAGGNLKLASASGALNNAAGALLWAGADMALRARRITNGKAALIESGGGMRLAARDTLINDLGSVRAGGDLRLDAARIENRATLTGHVRHAGENTVGGGGYGFWRGLAYLDYRLRYGNGAAVAAPFYDVALQAGQSRIESGGDLYVNRELGPGRRGHLRNEGTIQAVGHAYIDGDVENRSLSREVSLADYLRTPLAAAIELKVTDSRAALTPAYWSFRTLYELLDYLVGENRWETIWGFYDTYTDWATNTLKNLDLGYVSPPPPQAPPVPAKPELSLPDGSADSPAARQALADYREALREYEAARAQARAAEAYGEAQRQVREILAARYGADRLAGLDTETAALDRVIGDYAAALARLGDDEPARAQALRKQYEQAVDRIQLAPATPGRALLARALSAALGADWRAQPHPVLVQRWNDFKAGRRGAPLTFYPQAQTVLAAGKGVTLSDGYLRNGENAARNRGRPDTLRIGEHKVETSGGSFDALRGLGLETRLDIDGALEAVLANRHLFARVGDQPAASSVAVPAAMPAPQGDADPAALRDVPRKPVAPAVALPQPLIETRIKYLDQGGFYGSGYFFEQIGYQPDRATRVAGDNYFDTTLVREQVRRALGGYESRLPVRGDALVARLMESAGTVGKALGLKVGVAPTAQQLKLADRDFVWYVDTVIDGQKVLAPRLYLTEATRQGITDQYAGGGALIASGGDVTVNTDGHDVSSVNGLIQGRSVKVDAGKGKVVVADSKGAGGGIEADDEVDVSGRDIGIEGGKLRGKDVRLKADTVKVATSMRYDGKGRLAARGDGALDAQGGQLHIEAKRLETAGATLKGGKVKLDVDDVKLGGVYEAASSYENRSSTPLGSLFAILSSTTETSQSARANHYGTRIEAGTLEGKMQNLEIEGGSVDAAHTNLSVARDARFKAAADFAHAEHEKEVRQLFLGGKVGAGGYEAGFSLGSESGVSSHAGRGAASSASARVGWESVWEKSASSRKTYRNADLRLGDGLLAVGGVLDFGGADINRDRYGGGAEGEPGLRLRGGEVRTTKYVDTEHTVRSGGRVGLELGVDGSVNPQVTSSRLGRSLTQAGDGRGIDGGLMFGQALSTAFQSVMADTISSTLSASLRTEWWNESRNATSENLTHVGGNARIESGAGDMALAGVRFDGGREVDLRSAGALRMRSAESREQRTRDAHSLSLDARLAMGANLVKGDAYVRGTAGLSGHHEHAASERHTHGRTGVRAANVHLQAARDLVMQGARVQAAQGARVEVGGALSMASVQDVHDESHTSADWMAAAGAHASTGNGFKPQPVAQVGVSFSHGHDRGAIVAQRTGIAAGGPLSVRVAGDAQLIGADLVSTAGQGRVQVGGRVRAEQLADRRDRDGGSAGVSAPALLSTSTRPTLVVSGGRLERDHYDAVHRSVIAVSPGGLAAADGVSGHLQRDPVTGLRVLRDEHWAGGDMAFTLGSVPKFDRGKYAPPRPDTSAPGGSPFSLHR
ncbi:two-partner secretion domain-containing protein [Bordetella pertussis]|nr:hemagglutinin repeat-containing protein [Bordetella pertussis]ETA63959.1 adhesin FhaS [Bordetella pertussis CHLA-11]ETH03066.1 adhesin FhaS [Bordetella pertussis 2356847]ETH11086.1 adhesin FhaS [Bordetella pertussis STO1-SEAT-0006]ETH26272.1 adhesin FhaS [Bordetella pertussis CHLA-20]ETH46358.1 adhesin FhaS [Bordetella pertussis H921]ETH53579.1 adhesin FhaS [Bordetella pertussis I002]ETH74857.1 adhesin FhaS [Bordetella pertussis STO1-CHOC-0008]ETH95361.1 adhesin FhaS [Bordetella pertussi